MAAFGSGELFLSRVKCLDLLVEENLDTICGPDGDAGAEKIGVLCPDWTCQAESRGQHRPVAFVSTAQSLTGVDFKDAIEFRCDGLDQAAQIFESCREISLGLIPFF